MMEKRHIYKVTEKGLEIQNSFLDIKRGDKFVIFDPDYKAGYETRIFEAVSDGHINEAGVEAIIC